MKLSRLPVVVAIAALTVPGSGQAASFTAKQLSDVHVGSSKPEVKAQMAYSNYVLEHFKKPEHRWKLLPRHATCWSHVQSRALRQTCNHARQRYIAHRWLYEKADAIWEAKYAPRPAAVGIPWAFWDCVATGRLNGRYVSTGEGGATSYNPLGYYGRYQMDWGFMRSHGADMLAKYGGKPATSWSVADQTIVAERGFQVQGAPAWPNTAPPCMSLR